MKKVSAEEILQYLDEKQYSYKFIGNRNAEISDFSSIKQYREKTLTWAKMPYNTDGLDIEVCVVQEGVNVPARAIISTPVSKAVFFSVLNHFFAEKPVVGIGVGTYIGNRVKLGENVSIGNNCTLDGDICIGSGTHIGDNVVIRNCVKIGENCNIQSLTVIGEDGFGYIEDKHNTKQMISHFGGVIIGSEVFIGSHVNIARGTIDDTIIEDGVKIAPSTHIGHNNYIEENSTIICSELFGSVHVEGNAYIVSSVIRNQCTVGKNALVGMGSVVTRDVHEGTVVIGVPAHEKAN